MADKPIKRKPQNFNLYVETDEYGGFEPPLDLTMMMETVEDFIEKEKLDEYEAGMYAALVDIMSTPAALLHNRYAEILNTIIEIAEAPMVQTIKGSNLPSNKHNQTIDLQPEDLTDEETERELMSEEEHGQLDDWYYAIKGLTIGGWFDKTIGQKRAEKAKYELEQATKEKEEPAPVGPIHDETQFSPYDNN